MVKSLVTRFLTHSLIAKIISLYSRTIKKKLAFKIISYYKSLKVKRLISAYLQKNAFVFIYIIIRPNTS